MAYLLKTTLFFALFFAQLNLHADIEKCALKFSPPNLVDIKGSKEQQKAVANYIISSIEKNGLTIDANKTIKDGLVVESKTTINIRRKLTKLLKSSHLSSIQSPGYRKWFTDRIVNIILAEKFNTLGLYRLDNAQRDDLVVLEAVMRQIVNKGLVSLIPQTVYNPRALPSILDFRKHWDSLWSNPLLLPFVKLFNFELPNFPWVVNDREKLGNLLLSGIDSNDPSVREIVSRVLSTPGGIALFKRQYNAVIGIALIGHFTSFLLLEMPAEFKKQEQVYVQEQKADYAAALEQAMKDPGFVEKMNTDPEFADAMTDPETLYTYLAITSMTSGLTERILELESNKNIDLEYDRMIPLIVNQFEANVGRAPTAKELLEVKEKYCLVLATEKEEFPTPCQAK